jgi:hypothetical protein
MLKAVGRHRATSRDCVLRRDRCGDGWRLSRATINPTLEELGGGFRHKLPRHDPICTVLTMELLQFYYSNRHLKPAGD